VRDPHVERLLFTIGSGEGIAYENPAPLTFANAVGDFSTRDGILLVEPASHFADEATARSVIEPFLKSWEIETDLDSNPGAIRFKFLTAEIVDRDPPPPGADLSIQLRGESLSITGGKVKTLITYRSYPPPPSRFSATVNVVNAHARWLNYRAGHEPLQGTGYFVLTLIEVAAGTRRAAANVFQIDLDVLSKLGELTSTKGDPKTARKVPRGGPYQPLTGAEPAWLEQAVRVIIKRLGEHASGAALTTITLDDLPKL
jgi:hypothetical protein